MNTAQQAAQAGALQIIKEIEKCVLPPEDCADDEKNEREIYGSDFSLAALQRRHNARLDRVKSEAFAAVASMMVEEIQKRGHADIIKTIADFSTEALADCRCNEMNYPWPKWMWKDKADRFPRTAEKLIQEFNTAKAKCVTESEKKKLELAFMYKAVIEFTYVTLRSD